MCFMLDKMSLSIISKYTITDTIILLFRISIFLRYIDLVLISFSMIIFNEEKFKIIKQKTSKM